MIYLHQEILHQSWHLLTPTNGTMKMINNQINTIHIGSVTNAKTNLGIAM